MNGLCLSPSHVPHFPPLNKRYFSFFQSIFIEGLIYTSDMMCCAQSLSRVRLLATPWTVACQAPLSMGILQARILEWVAMAFPRGSSQPRGQTQVSHIAGDSLSSEPPGKPMNTGVGSLSVLQGIFLTKGSNQGLLHCRQILYWLNYPGSPILMIL